MASVGIEPSEREARLAELLTRLTDELRQGMTPDVETLARAREENWSMTCWETPPGKPK